METENNETPIVVIGGNGQWGKTIVQSLHGNKPSFQNIQIVEKDDFPGRKNAAIATSEIIIHAAGEEAIEEMWIIHSQPGFAELVFPGKVLLEICSTKKSVEKILTLLHTWWVDVCSLHPLCKPEKTARAVSEMLIMPWERESRWHNFARILTQALNMKSNENITFNQHDTIMETSQVKRHIAAWEWLENIETEIRKLWLSLHQFPFPISEKIMIAGLSRVWSGNPELSAKIIGNSLWWEKSRIMKETDRFRNLIHQLDPDWSFIRKMNDLADSCLQGILRAQLLHESVAQ